MSDESAMKTFTLSGNQFSSVQFNLIDTGLQLTTTSLISCLLYKASEILKLNVIISQSPRECPQIAFSVQSFNTQHIQYPILYDTALRIDCKMEEKQRIGKAVNDRLISRFANNFSFNSTHLCFTNTRKSIGHNFMSYHYKPTYNVDVM